MKCYQEPTESGNTGPYLADNQSRDVNNKFWLVVYLIWSFSATRYGEDQWVYLTRDCMDLNTQDKLPQAVPGFSFHGYVYNNDTRQYLRIIQGVIVWSREPGIWEVMAAPRGKVKLRMGDYCLYTPGREHEILIPDWLITSHVT